MKSYRLPLFTLIGLYLVFAAVLFASTGMLSERVASHFGAEGNVDGWTSRREYLQFFSLFGLLFPLALPLLTLPLRFFPVNWINLPNRDYWLAPERRRETLQHLFYYSIWYGCASLVFVIGLHALTIEANRLTPPHLSGSGMALMTGVYLASLVVILICMLRPFFKKPPAES